MASRLDAARVSERASVRDALLALEKGAAEIALVVDGADRLVGTLTDGDLRRALLAGAGLDTPLGAHVQRNFTAVSPQATRAEVIDLMRARTIGQIPIVDGDGKLVGLHRLHELIGAEERTNWAVVMAGGQGQRLRPITDEIPKPMIRIAGRPILERVVLHLIGFGIRRIFLSINYLGHVIEQHFGDGSRFGCRIEYLREPRALGTGGSLSLLPEPPREPLLVMNGDLVTEAEIGAMLEFHARGGQRATVGVRRYSHTVPFGVVELDGDRIVQMEEKPRLVRLVNAGIYVLDPPLVARVPRDQELGLPSLLEGAIARGERVSAFEIQADWIDVGHRDQLKQAREGGDT
jgi:dTDP-glucose pyrophosphorylase